MKLRLSPSTVITVIALVAALGGTAYAAGAFTKKQKKQVTKIATQVFDSRIGGASVKRAGTVTRAETVTRASEAGKATEATKAQEALRAVRATSTPEATRADEATKVPEAVRATEATRADEATRATTAGNAEQLGGRASGEYQVPLRGGCGPLRAISTVQANGAILCTTPVQPVRADLVLNGSRNLDLGNGLRLVVDCTNAFASLDFVNLDQPNVNFNLLLIDNSGFAPSGTSSGPGVVGQTSTATRLAYHVVWASPTAITTLRMDLSHAIGGSNCRLAGTALTGLG